MALALTTFAIANREGFCFKAVTLIVTEDGYEPTFKNGTYEANPKHGMIQHVKSSPGLSQDYGKYALNNAISAGPGKALYAYNGKNILQFMPSNSSATIWHGFATNLGGINRSQAANWLLHYFKIK